MTALEKFKTPLEKGAFLLGVLTQILLEKERTEKRTNSIFFKLNLSYLKMKDLREIYTELRAKYEEKNLIDDKIQRIFAEAGKYLLKSPRTIAKKDGAYAFTLGMNLKNQFLKEV